ncbi:GGDEF domain-containing response regulator [Bremerella cremea]|uniref:diguanylate cyclase n=1 Tax=Blastopirellula marina TaxID=124 RepID=A0A2S8FRD4_9BACT|nr:MULTISPECIES: GGDEF domain-containing response regulator [Pirellulaceae]PQO34620.1 hypothetical protein C5Y83_14010 [Blastopirellula marina]RCS47117.1 GGDEF domain-containing response regulator [Bremerella cremea]
MHELQKIVIIEDDNVAAKVLEDYLLAGSSGRYTMYRVRTLQDACQLLCDESIDVIILDLGLPDSKGLSSIQTLRVASPHSAIVVMTAHDDDEDACQAIQYGAQAYVAKQERVGRRISTVVRHAFIRQQRQLVVEAQAHTDPLTGIANRRAFDAEIERCIANFVRHNVPFSLLLFDIDRFKSINDQWGHLVGDQALMNVAKTLQRQTRCTDLVTRFGGEEFAVVAATTELIEAFSLASRIRRAIDLLFQEATDEQPRLTVSGGVAGYMSSDNVLTVMERADTALYQAKQRGRNQCAVHLDNWIVSDQDEAAFDWLSQSVKPPQFQSTIS